jgi:hypothetical protein
MSFVSFDSSTGQAQRIVDALTHLVIPVSQGPRETVSYVGGLELQVDTWWLNTQGNQVETEVIAAFPLLRKFQKRLLAEIVNKVWRDRPFVVPKSTLLLLQRFLD